MILESEGSLPGMMRLFGEKGFAAMKSNYKGAIYTLSLFCLLLVVLVAYPATNAKATSFDCDEAKSAVEKMICTDTELSKLDEEMAAAYKTALGGPSPGSVKETQKKWLKTRNQCRDAACLKSSYSQQLALLQSLPVTFVSPVQSPNLSDTAMISHANCPEPNIDWRNYEWTIIVGSGRTSCEEMLAYLKSRPRDQPPPVCAEERLPPNGNWTRPAWQEVTEAQRQRFLENIPENENTATLGMNKLLHKGKLMTAHTDMSGDGVPEHILALYFSFSNQEESPPINRIYSQEAWDDRCRLSTRCAQPKGTFNGQICLRDEGPAELLPLNFDGTKIDWEHWAVKRKNGFVFGPGELIHYKKRPYWLSDITWCQEWHDDFTRYASDPNSHLANIFHLGPLLSNKINPKNAPEEREEPKIFDQITSFYTSDKTNCYFGYFHRENLKRNPPRNGR